MIYQGGLCSFVIPNKNNPAYKLRSKKANYRRGLLHYKFPSHTLLFLQDALDIAKELDSTPLPLQKKTVLKLQLNIVFKKLIPKFVMKTNDKGDCISELEQAITLYKAIELKDTLGLREKYFKYLIRASH